MTAPMFTKTQLLAPGEYKTITLWQPYATLIATGIKRYETRSWPTNYRGPLLIHAAKRKMTQDDIHILRSLNSRFPGLNVSCNPTDYPLMAILSKVFLVDCLKMTSTDGQYSTEREVHLNTISELDKLVGHCADGRYSWEIRPSKRLNIPEVKGKQGFWNYLHPENPHNAEFDL